MPTWRNISTARSRASPAGFSWWSWIASLIWLPMVYTGLRLVIGSWKIIAISPPRMRR